MFAIQLDADFAQAAGQGVALGHDIILSMSRAGSLRRRLPMLVLCAGSEFWLLDGAAVCGNDSDSATRCGGDADGPAEDLAADDGLDLGEMGFRLEGSPMAACGLSPDSHDVHSNEDGDAGSFAPHYGGHVLTAP